jgi:hypothetical protein
MQLQLQQQHKIVQQFLRFIGCEYRKITLVNKKVKNLSEPDKIR